MSTQIGETTYPKAKKDYQCMASDWIINGDLAETFRCCDWEQKRSIIRARRNGYKILKGQKYLRQAIVFEGRMETFRAIPEMHEICVEYDLYQE